MAKPRLAPIYERLAGAPQYHPMNAETFADWSLEAGDIVTVKREGTGYSSPVHTVRMKWNGVPTTQIESVGEKKRESIAKMSAQKYARGGGGGAGVRNAHYQHIQAVDMYGRMVSGLELTGSTAKLYAEDLYRQMGSGLALTTSSAHLYVDDRYNQMKSGLALTSSTAALYVEDSYNRLKSGLDLTSSSAALYVDNKYNQMKSGLSITMSSAVMYARSKEAAAEIVARINEDNEGEIKLDAQHVYIGNTKSTTVINGKLSTNELAARIADLAIVEMVAAQVTGNIACYGVVSAKSLAVNQNYGITLGGTGTFSGVKLGSYNAFTDCVTDASVANNVLTLTKASGDTVTFSKATTLTGGWSGGRFTATASPQDVSYYTDLSQGEVSWDGNTATVPINAHDNSQSQYKRPTGASVTVDASAIYAAGRTRGHTDYTGKDASVTQKSGQTWYVDITRNDDSSQRLEVNMSSVYSKAREGYTQGTFTSLTARPVVSSGGTVYYQAGTAATYYKGNGSGGYLCGTGVTCYKEGTEKTFNLRASSSIKLKKYGTGEVTLYTAPQYGAPGIKHEWYYIDSGGTSYYQAAGTATVTMQGESQTLYPRGSYVYGRGDTVSVTPITGTAIRIGAAGTYYSKS